MSETSKTYEVQIHLKNCGVVSFERQWEGIPQEFLRQVFQMDYSFHECKKTNRHFAVCSTEITGIIMEEKPLDKPTDAIEHVEDDGW